MNVRRPKSQSPAPEPLPERPPLPRYGYTVEELAEILCCGRTTVYELIERWGVKTFYVGRKPMVSPWELERAIRDQEKAS